MSERQPTAKIQLKPGDHVHLMGICGTAMASLAGLLHDRGYKVTGSDQNVYPPMSTQLDKIGIKIMEGYKAENLNLRPDLVIVGNVITRKHEEALALMQSDIPFASLPQAMGELVIQDRHCVVVAGTHGKTTTTSMMAFILDQLMTRPGFMIGGIPKNFDQSYRAPSGHWFVIEGDEYDTAFFDKVPKFIHYRPQSVILTSVEFDHADIYKDLEAVKQAFLKLLDLIPSDGVLVTNAQDANIEDLLLRKGWWTGGMSPQIVTFGIGKGTYQTREVQLTSSGTKFMVMKNGERVTELEIKLIGDYNVKNALAAFALAHTLGFEAERIKSAISGFQGVKRRQEVIGRPRDITIYEDFAHHPTAVGMTLETLRARHKTGKIIGVFEARSATSRRAIFQKDYAEALAKADLALMPPPFNQTNIAENDRFSSEQLMHDIKSKGGKAEVCPTVDDIVARIKLEAKPGDTVVIMSNGGFGGIYEKLLQALA